MFSVSHFLPFKQDTADKKLLRPVDKGFYRCRKPQIIHRHRENDDVRLVQFSGYLFKRVVKRAAVMDMAIFAVGAGLDMGLKQIHMLDGSGVLILSQVSRRQPFGVRILVRGTVEHHDIR